MSNLFPFSMQKVSTQAPFSLSWLVEINADYILYFQLAIYESFSEQSHTSAELCRGLRWTQGSISPTYLHAKIPKVQKDIHVISVFLRFWDLNAQKLLVKHC